MKTYFFFKVLFAIKAAIVSAAFYLLAKFIFQKSNFDFLNISGSDMRLNRYDV
jgi:hypothetical protein